MRVLAIETSCDETAVAVLECSGNTARADFRVLGNALYSQAAQHAEYGGVYPSLAKREHQANLVPLATQALHEAGLLEKTEGTTVNCSSAESIRDEKFKESVLEFLKRNEKPEVDMIAVTRGPGLEPALWTGISFAKALGDTWNTPVIGIDHMEGHIVSALLQSADTAETRRLNAEERRKNKQEPERYTLDTVRFPLLALLISGGHTELILMKRWFEYRAIGRTRDDAVGEAFDKVARMLSLPYPGGPRIAELAARSRQKDGENPFLFPSPMTEGVTCDFSFSGLKTSVLYTLKKMDGLSETEREHVAEAFEDAAKDALVIQTRKALRKEATRTLAIAGGVSANETIRKAFEVLVKEEFPKLTLMVPEEGLTGDNAIMIGAAAYLRHTAGKVAGNGIQASGKLRLETSP